MGNEATPLSGGRPPRSPWQLPRFSPAAWSPEGLTVSLVQPGRSLGRIQAEARTLVGLDGIAMSLERISWSRGSLESMTRVFLLIACFLMMGVSVWGQEVEETAKRFETLIANVGDDSEHVRIEAIRTLADMAIRGEDVTEALPALADALRDESELFPDSTQGAVYKIGNALKERGRLAWWFIPRVYWTQLIATVVLLVGWFISMSRFPRPRTTQERIFNLVAATLPTLLAPWAVHHAVTRDWVQGFLPDPIFTLLPFPVAAVLSTAFLCILAAVWACARKPVEGTAVETLKGEEVP